MRSAAIIIMALGCGTAADTPQVLGGVEISASVFDAGRRVYERNCLPCHGERGDGAGPSAKAAWPPPRDFRRAAFKFAGIEDRGLPADAELARIITSGLPGSSMPAWDLPPSELADVVDYIKTFSPAGVGFRDPKMVVSTPRIGPAPPADLAEGARIYHELFECDKCHPSYVDESHPVPAAKWSETYRTILLPTDFRRHPMRSVRRGPDGANLADLYRVIAYGLQGPMPGSLHLGEANVWAVAHYVKSIADGD